MTKALSFAAAALLLIASCNVLCQDESRETPEANTVVERIMSSAFARCHSERNGVKGLSFVPPTTEEMAEVVSMGDDAIAPLASYFDAEPNGGFLQLFAVKFLEALNRHETFSPLARAFDHDQCEVTRNAALNAMFALSEQEAKPYVEAALSDESKVVKQSAARLWALYKAD